MCTVRIVIPCPGTLAPIASETPSFGWTWISSTFGRSPSAGAVLERRMRRPLELDRDRRLAPREPLAHPDVERRVGPAPVVDEELRRDERLGHRVGRDALLLAIAAAPPRPRRSRGPYWPRTTCFGPGRVHRLQHLHLLVAHGVGGEVDRRLHRGDRDELQQVVLEDVADRAGLLVVRRAPLDPDRLGDGDLHVVDELAVPDRLEDAVREPQRQHVLHRLLAEVVVDAEDLALGEVLLQARVQLARRREVVAERLLDDQPDPALGRAPRRDLAHERPDRARRHREVVDAVAPRAALLVELRRACRAGRPRALSSAKSSVT